MKYTLLFTHIIIHRRISSQRFEGYSIVVLRTIIKHTFMKGVA
jgi:hypothetical protein